MIDTSELVHFDDGTTPMSFDMGDLSPNGAYWVIYREPCHSAIHVAKAKKYIKQQHDVVGFHVRSVDTDKAKGHIEDNSPEWQEYQTFFRVPLDPDNKIVQMRFIDWINQGEELAALKANLGRQDHARK